MNSEYLERMSHKIEEQKSGGIINNALDNLSFNNDSERGLNSKFLPRERAKSEGDSEKSAEDVRSGRFSVSSDTTTVDAPSTSVSTTTIAGKSDSGSTFNSPENPQPPNACTTLSDAQKEDESVPRPDSLSLPKPQKEEKSNENLVEYVSNNFNTIKEWRACRSASTSTAGEMATKRDPEFEQLEETLLSKSMPPGILSKKGEMVEFVADDLQEMIKQSSPHTKTESSGLSSRTSSLRSLSSVASASSSVATSGMSRSPSSLFQHSPDDMPAIDPQAVLDLETHAKNVADSLDLMMGNLKSNLHKMSAITVGCLDAYKTSVDVTCDSVDSSIKAMYAMMAKCEELSNNMRPVYKLSDQIKEIKRLLDRFEQQMAEKNS